MTSLRIPTALVHLAVVTGASTTLAAAQGQAPPPIQIRGIASVWAAGLSIDTPAATTSAQDNVRLKPPGDQTTPPPTWAQVGPNGSPLYLLAEMFPSTSFGLMDVAGRMEMDALSLGGDLIPDPVTTSPLDPSRGLPNVSPTTGNWLSYTMSVTNNAVAATGSYFGSVTPGQRGADLVSYYTELSANIPTGLPGNVIVEQQASHLGFGSGVPPEVDALDYGLGAVTFDPTARINLLLFPVRDEFYFSVTQEFCTWFITTSGTSGQRFAMGLTQMEMPHAAAIYKIEWDDQTGWSAPIVYKSPQDLAYEGTIPTNVDALAVNATNGKDNIIFSVGGFEVYTGGFTPQLLYYHNSSGSDYVAELMDNDGSSILAVTDKVGLERGSGDVDGLCSLDPKDPSSDPMVSIPQNSMATASARGELSLPGNTMGVSMQRALRPTGGLPPTDPPLEDLYVHISGYGTPTAPLNSDLYVCLRVGSMLVEGINPLDQASLAGGEWSIVGPIARSSSGPSTWQGVLYGAEPGRNHVQIFGVNFAVGGPVTGSLVGQIRYDE